MSDLKVTNAECWVAGMPQGDSPPVLADVGKWTLPIKSAYAFTKIRRKVAEALKDVNEAREQLLIKHTDKDADGKPLTRDAANGQKEYAVTDMQAYQSEFQALLEESVELTGCRKVTLEEMGEDARPTPVQMEALAPFLAE